eukprot:1318626-Prorocentrum_lima.AAC.1
MGSVDSGNVQDVEGYPNQESLSTQHQREIQGQLVQPRVAQQQEETISDEDQGGTSSSCRAT